jgi:hypothetical protein
VQIRFANRANIGHYMRLADLLEAVIAFWSLLSASDTHGAEFRSGNFLESAAAQETYVKPREAADRALALSPDLAVARSARGDLLQTADLEAHGRECRRLSR